MLLLSRLLALQCAATALAASLSSSSGARNPTDRRAARDATRLLVKQAYARNWRQALKTLRALPDPDVVHYNAAINACNRGGQWEKALELLGEMTAAVASGTSASTATAAATVTVNRFPAL